MIFFFYIKIQKLNITFITYDKNDFLSKNISYKYKLRNDLIKSKHIGTQGK